MVPETILPVQTATVRVRVTEGMVARFAALTGDRSSLHVNDAFARRSVYRRPVVHGMLPVAFIAALSPFRLDGHCCVPVAMTGRFAAPVYPGDEIAVTIESATTTDGGEVRFTYRIAQAKSNAIATDGTVTVRYDRDLPARVDGVAMGSATMLPHDIEMNSYRLEQIEPGLEDAFDFSVGARSLSEFRQLLAEGVMASVPLDDLADRFYLPNLLTGLLLSTSVGVSLPGASATFLEFSARFQRRIELDTPYHLGGCVAHRSMATRIIKKEICVAPVARPEDVAVIGKVAALVNPESRRMPSIDDLRNSALDLGLKDKVVLVTGASRGIGETTAKLFALHGARVVVTYHRGAVDAARVVDEIQGASREAIAVAADVSNDADVRRLVETTIARFGAIDILVNNAARDYRPTPFLNLTWDEMQKDLDVIAKGAFLCCQQAIPFMLQQGGGKIVNVSSVAVDNPPPDQTKYVVAKSALVGLTRSLSIEFAARNIQVNLVVPNFVETDFVAHVQEGFRKKIAQDTPMRRTASPAEVARAVVVLASSYSSFTTGQKVVVTGGGAPYF